MRNFFLILFVLVTIIVVNLNYASKDVIASGITLKGLIQTAIADTESTDCGPNGECPYGYYCYNGTCKPYVSLQTQYCSIVDWCWCESYDPYQIDRVQVACQGVETVCNPDPYGSISCSFGTECHGCDPCTDGDPPSYYSRCF